MIGCEYCRMEDDGEDFGSDLKPLIRVEETGRRFDTEDGCEETYHSESFEVWSIYNVTIFDDRLQLAIGDASEIGRKINYCPMCGRRLGNVKL